MYEDMSPKLLLCVFKAFSPVVRQSFVRGSREISLVHIGDRCSICAFLGILLLFHLPILLQMANVHNITWLCSEHNNTIGA